MNKNISLILMITAILLIAAFQIYWLNVNYEEQKRDLRFRTNVLFRESIFDLRASKLKLDTTARLRYGLPPDVSRFMDAIRSKITDSVQEPSRVNPLEVISLEKKGGLGLADSVPRAGYRSAGRFFEFLIGIDSLQDSLRLVDVSNAYTATLKKENVLVNFNIERTPDSLNRANPPKPEWNKVTIGFSNPVTYTLELGNVSSYLLSKMIPQILFSVFLIGLTITAFTVLYKNLRAQQKLTGIKNEFISNITHELKTPISTVGVAIEAIKNFDVLRQPEKAREYLDIAGNELNRLSMLVDKVLRLSMFEKHATELKPESFDLRQLTEEVINSMGLQFEKAGAKVFLHTEGESFVINADKVHITSVLYNLVDNALKYSGDQPVLNIAVKNDGHTCIVRVKDNGPGIPEEYQAKIFEKFFRVPTNNRHNVKGYGLGLSYIAHIIDQHKGTITLQSQPGQGAEFIVKLPVNE
ncbi:MAG: HAMP domain-containing histidine kinase [Chitinophagaceae bacterium]|nr:HAMP domain-containing histidine kinase [Chitinophagaceae bacterium]MCW5929748.1 HAMP domain-containing histidine kinase [Chitinophagaceae bacterium]